MLTTPATLRLQQQQEEGHRGYDREKEAAGGGHGVDGDKAAISLTFAHSQIWTAMLPWWHGG